MFPETDLPDLVPYPILVSERVKPYKLIGELQILRILQRKLWNEAIHLGFQADLRSLLTAMAQIHSAVRHVLRTSYVKCSLSIHLS